MEAEADAEESVGEESPTKKTKAVGVVKRETVGEERDLDDMFQ